MADTNETSVSMPVYAPGIAPKRNPAPEPASRPERVEKPAPRSRPTESPKHGK